MRSIAAFFRQLLAAPFKILLFVLGFFHVFPPFLVRIIWRLGGEIDYATRLIGAIGKKDLAAARKEAEALLQQTRDSRIAATIILYEFYICHNAEAVHRWVMLAEELECSCSELLLQGKLLLCNRIDGYEVEDIVGQILSRNDLPMNYTSLAYAEMADKHIENKQWEQADEILDHVLSIENHAISHGLKWITETAQGNPEKGLSHLEQYRKAGFASFVTVFEAAGYYYLDDLDKAKACLLRAMDEYGVPKDYIAFVKPELASMLEEERAA